MRKISEKVYLEMKNLISEYEKKQSEISETDVQEPYITKISILKKLKYNPKYGNNRICECGHPYHRHFDSYEKMSNIGCKYCPCYTFKEITEEFKEKALAEVKEYVSSEKEVVFVNNPFPKNHLYAVRGQYCEFAEHQNFVEVYLRKINLPE